MEIVPIVAIISTFGIVPLIIYLVNRHKQRMAILEKGGDPGVLDSFKKDHTMSSLKYGILLVGLAVGILAGNLLSEYTRMLEEVAYFSMLFLFGGVALLIFYSLAKKQKENE